MAKKPMMSVSKEAGAGRGLMAGPTAEDWRDVEEEGITTERKIKRGDYGKPGMAPTDLMPPVKKARGGMIRGGGCEQRGKTRGKMV